MAESRKINLRDPIGIAEVQSEVAFDAQEGSVQPIRSERGDFIDRSAIVQAAAAQGIWVDATSLAFFDADGQPSTVYLIDGGSELLFHGVNDQPERFLEQTQ